VTSCSKEELRRILKMAEELINRLKKDSEGK